MARACSQTARSSIRPTASLIWCTIRSSKGSAIFIRQSTLEALKFLILFSSSTARFGRSGQVAYAAANEALNKWAQQQSVQLPHCRVVSYNWGPWAGGMVNDSLRTVFEKEGLSLIPLEAGARLVVDEIRRGGSGTGRDCCPRGFEHGGRRARASATTHGRTPAASERLDTVFRRTVDVDSLPVLASHVIDGHAVLPMAIILEWLAEGAVHRNPGLVVCGLDNLQLFKGVIIGKNHEPRARDPRRQGRTGDGHFVVPTELEGHSPSGREVAHARANVVLADRYATHPRTLAEASPCPIHARTTKFTRPSCSTGRPCKASSGVDGLAERTIAGWVATSPAPSEWLEQPLRNAWLTDPLAIDSAFQLVVLWCRERLGANSLPTAIGGYRQFRRHFRPRACTSSPRSVQASSASQGRRRHRVS